MDTSQWSQAVGLVNGLEGNNGTGTCSKPAIERKVRTHVQKALNCPRCSSTNTKFCYYNNYSLSQPRYLCKTCRRYWTEGGSLRNIPVGGGSRKNKRSSTSSSSSSSSSSASSHKLIPDLSPPTLSRFSSQNTEIHGRQDLNLGFSATQDCRCAGFPHQFVKLPEAENNDSGIHHISSSASHSLSALELLRTGIGCRGLTSFLPTPMPMPMPDSNTLYAPVFPLPESKPAFSFSADGSGTRFGSSLHGVQEFGTARVMLPFGAPKEFQSSSEVDDQTKGQTSSTGYWNGRLGGEAW